MAALIDDEMRHTIAACGTPAEIAAHIRDRVAGISETVCLYQAAPIGLETLAAIIDELRQGATVSQSANPDGSCRPSAPCS